MEILQKVFELCYASRRAELDELEERRWLENRKVGPGRDGTLPANPDEQSGPTGD